MDEAEIIKNLKVLRSANKKSFGQESLTEVLALAQNNNKNMLSVVQNNYYDLIDYLAVMKGQELAKIYHATSRDEISLLTDVLLSINMPKIDSLDPAEITQKINLELVREKSSLQIKQSPDIKKIISKIIIFEQIKRACRLFSVYEETMEILPYCKKYILLRPDELTSDLMTLEKCIADTKILIINDNKAREVAIDYLSKKGYPDITTQNKNGGELISILEKHYLAALAVRYLQEEKKGTIVNNQNDLIDVIALFLLDQEDIGATD
ncbi:hypothetical protein COT78_03725 [Candidatus Berkelbacteria bacterium CG10_big_fil_rev_8_21_14_0_10_43_13]|uniref:Uncharacterized protein n=1 Tax=Candidatus Berkelbacteria bacterium CG10_big_fil_rev_8_21_14_0_10_43_13 TaxID=1974514 RepID=A0A2H0W5T5_9BACT|nr:MAG: hypothetical protein COT78_03725 [Candidatus Berkelbacteria bacterium CG10_big_fil_rev_8_21_14_0_10_43_13]